MTDTKIKILIAEDDLIIARDIKKTLEDTGYNVVSVVDNAKDAIRLSEDKDPDLIVMDIMLKGKMTGLDAAEHINKSRNTPIIFLSALCDDETFLNAYLLKPFAYLTKPFRRVELLKKIDKIFKSAG
jgi:CheY-like chemotaxis protein